MKVKTYRKAAAEYKCNFCDKPIKPGDLYRKPANHDWRICKACDTGK